MVAARGRAGSEKKMMPSNGFGAKPIEPVTIESMIASPSARAVASTAAATIAGRAARTLTVHIARQRLTPRETAPSRPARRNPAEGVDHDRNHDRRDHHRQDQDPDADRWRR